MKLIKIALATAAIIAAPSVANAAVVVNIAQTGANVTATASGTLNLAGLTTGLTTGNFVGISPQRGFIGFGVGGTLLQSYIGFTPNTGFGTSNAVVAASSSTGTNFAFNASSFGPAYVFLPTTYSSGGSIAATDVFNDTTLAGLGLTIGSFVYQSANDSITINVGNVTPAVPEPATWAMMLLGFGMIGFGMRYGVRRSNAKSDLKVKRIAAGLEA